MTGNIRKFLDLSTAHLDDASKEWLTNAAQSQSAYEGPYGWFTCAYPDPDNPGHTSVQPGLRDMQAPAPLAAIMEYACQLGCDYVLFDGDAVAVEDLPVFEE